MDNTAAVISAYVALVVSGAATVVGIINHRKIRSRCCGHVAEFAIDIDNTTPPGKTTPLLSRPPLAPLKSPPSDPSAPPMLEG